MNRRRKLLALAAACALGPVLPVRAQARLRRIAWLSNSPERDGAPFLGELRRGLGELGYVEGGNLAVDARWGDDLPGRLSALAAELAASPAEVIVTQGPTVPALRAAGPKVPIVFGFSGDPVEAGFVQSLSRPGGNLTGMSFLTLELVGKRIELLRETIPGLKRIAAVANPQHPGDKAERRASQEAANALGIELKYFEARTAAELDRALGAIGKSGSQAGVIFPTATVISERERIARWAVEHRIPTISGWAQFAEGGNLMSYGPNLRASFRRLAVFVDAILKGAKAADIPVERPSTVELVVNMRAAAALGLRVPNSILLRADRVIE